MTEKKFRSVVVPMLRPLFAFSVENAVGVPGVPDVATTIGWIELKLAKRPRSPNSPVRPHVRNEQRIWHRRWRRAGGASWFLTLLGQQWWILHDGVWAAENFDHVSEKIFLENAISKWISKPRPPQLVQQLRRHHGTREDNGDME